MRATGPLDIVHHFAIVQDPRDPRFVTHRLGDLLTIAWCATLSGAKNFEDLAAFGRTKEIWPCLTPHTPLLHEAGPLIPYPTTGTFPPPTVLPRRRSGLV